MFGSFCLAYKIKERATTLSVGPVFDIGLPEREGDNSHWMRVSASADVFSFRRTTGYIVPPVDTGSIALVCTGSGANIKRHKPNNGLNQWRRRWHGIEVQTDIKNPSWGCLFGHVGKPACRRKPGPVAGSLCGLGFTRLRLHHVSSFHPSVPRVVRVFDNWHRSTKDVPFFIR